MMSNRRNIDRYTLRLLGKTGSDFNKVHDFNFYLYYGSKENALLARTVIERDDFEVEIIPPDRREDWRLFAHKRMIPDEVELTELRDWFESVASLALTLWMEKD